MYPIATSPKGKKEPGCIVASIINSISLGGYVYRGSGLVRFTREGGQRRGSGTQLYPPVAFPNLLC